MKAPEGFMCTSSTLHFAWRDAAAYLATAEMCPICSKIICLPFETEIPTVLEFETFETNTLKTSAGACGRSFSLSGTIPRRDSSNDDHVVGLLCFDHGAVSWRIGHATNGAI